jgi:DNA-binding LacI/PurR family transcriptional regulator
MTTYDSVTGGVNGTGAASAPGTLATSTQRARPTMASIAREAGVSVPTVSKVLNGWSDVAPSTRQRVEALLDQRGYVRRSGAGRSAAAPGLVEVVIDSLNNSWAAALLGGVEAACHQTNLGVSVSVARDSGHGARPATSWIDRVVARGSRGVLLALVDVAATQRARLDRLGIPYVVIDPVATPQESIYSVGATNWAGGMSATQHLLELGHRRIGVVGGPHDVLCVQARIAGYRAAMARAGVEVPEEYVRYGADFGTYTGRDATMELLDLDQPPTALFICADTMALGAYRALRERGLQVPDDLSIVGFDDRPESHWVSPRLTTIRQPLDEMAQAAVSLLVRLMRGETPQSRRIELATSLLERDSTAPLNGGIRIAAESFRL